MITRAVPVRVIGAPAAMLRLVTTCLSDFADPLAPNATLEPRAPTKELNLTSWAVKKVEG